MILITYNEPKENGMNIRIKLRKRHKWLKKCFIIFVVVVIGIPLLLKFVLEFYYRDFYASSFKEFVIPDLNHNFVPQGLEYCTDNDVFLISGYMSDTGTVRLYVVNKDRTYRMIKVKIDNDENLISHAGGICINGEYIYIAGCDGKCYVIQAKLVLDGQSDYVTVNGSFNTGNEATFCYVYDKHLFVGEYYHILKYSTNETHHIITPAGDENKALIVSFPLDNSCTLGVKEEPVAAYSIPERIQGMCFSDDGRVILSASSIFSGSQLYFYDYIQLSDSEDYIEIQNITVPLYYFDSSNILQEKEILPKAEGIIFLNGRLYMLFESASNRFIYGKLINGQFLYSIELYE